MANILPDRTCYLIFATTFQADYPTVTKSSNRDPGLDKEDLNFGDKRGIGIR